MIWFAEALIASTVLMVAVLVIREPVASRFGARAAYLLWLAPALRMLLPPLPTDGFAALGPLEPVGNSAALFWLGFWALGCAVFLVWHIAVYRHFTSRARQRADWLYIDGRIEVAANSTIKSPVAFGILDQFVMLPADFSSRYTPAEQRLAIAHEVAHHRRWDLATNFIALILLALHWFNPIAHYAYRAFRIDQEAACDADVLAGASADDRHAYGTALFKSTVAGTPLAACASGAAATLKTRLMRIAAPAVRKPSLVTAALMLCGLALAIVITASTSLISVRSVPGPKAFPSLAFEDLPRVKAPAESVAPREKRTPPSVIELARIAPEFEWPLHDRPAHDRTASQPAELKPVAILAHAVDCQSGRALQMLTVYEADVQAEPRSVILTMCGHQKTEAQNEAAVLIPALVRAREGMASDSVLDPAVRQHAITELDRQISETRREAGEGSALKQDNVYLH